METSPEGSPGDGYEPLTDFCLSNNCPPPNKTQCCQRHAGKRRHKQAVRCLLLLTACDISACSYIILGAASSL